MLKLAGIILIVVGCSGLGGYGALRYVTRVRMLRELEQNLQFLYGEIAYSACDMVELFHKLSFRGGYFGEFWLSMKNQLLSRQGRRLGDYWKEEVRNVKCIEAFQAEEFELFLSLGSNLGNMDRQSQMKTIQMYGERFAEIRKEAAKEYHGKAKVCMVAGVTMGLFLAIFFA